MLRITLLLGCAAVAIASTSTMILTPSPPSAPAPKNTSTISTPSSSLAPSTTMPLSTTMANHTSLMSATSMMSSSMNMSKSIMPSSANSSVMPSSSMPTPKPTTHMPPTTMPPPLFGDFSVKENGKYCLLAQLEATFNVTYTQNTSVVNKTRKAYVVIKTPTNSTEFDTSKSQCETNGTAKLVITWSFYSFEIDFKATVAKALEAEMNYTNWEVNGVTFTANLVKNPDFINATEKMIQVHVNGSEFTNFKGKFDGYYTCSPKSEYDLSGDVKLDMNHVKLQPFMSASVNETWSGDFYDCEPEKPTKKPEDDGDIVPIAVGCALAGLVLIVLIAYIIGRRKSNRGYEKV